MAQGKPRVKVPKTAKAGAVIDIKTTISHPMHSGLAKDKKGNPIPRQIINKFECKFNGKVVFTADLEPSIAANPYIQFSVKVNESGTFEFIWYEDGGANYTTSKDITVQ